MNIIHAVARWSWLVSLSALSCSSSITLTDVDFGWPVESVSEVDQTNRVEVTRYGVAFSVEPVAAAEFGNPNALIGRKVNILRSSLGYYFLVASEFKSVYVFTPGEGELHYYDAIEVSQKRLKSPALNQRPPHIELLDGNSFRRLLTHDGIAEGDTP